MSHSNSGKQKEVSKSTNCHQCRRNNRGRVVYCSKCGTKQYCVRCIENRYRSMVEASFAEACPACRGICNCSECRKPKSSSSVATDSTAPGISRFMEESRTLPANYPAKENNPQGGMLPPREDNAQGLIVGTSKGDKIVEVKSPPGPAGAPQITGSGLSNVPRDSEAKRIEALRKFEILDEFEKLLTPIFGKQNNS